MFTTSASLMFTKRANANAAGTILNGTSGSKGAGLRPRL